MSASAAIDVVGSDSDNLIIGNSGANIIEGAGGADIIDGGGGTDKVTYVGSAKGISVSLATGEGSGGDAEDDVLLNVENIVGSNHDDTIEGDGAANVLDGGSRIDTISYQHASAAVTVNLGTTSAQATGGAGSDTISNFESLSGSAYNDILTGTSGANAIFGDSGNDSLAGLAGADSLDGSDGADTANYAASTGAVTISLKTGIGTGGDASGDTLKNIENITATAGDDILEGNSSDNVLHAGTGGIEGQFAVRKGELTKLVHLLVFIQKLTRSPR